MPPNPMFVTTTHATAVPMLATETVIFRARKSLIVLLTAVVVVSILGIVLAIIVNTLSMPDQILRLLRLGIAVAIIFIDIIIVLDWLSTIYTLTDRRVQFRFGIIGEQVKTIALEQITDTRVQIGIIGRIFNYGSVVIDAANINSQIVFASVTTAQDKLDQINQALLNRHP